MRTDKRGFTLVELNISVLFVALLILGVALTTVQVTRMYQKGVTVKTVNQTGRDIIEQLRRDFANASPGVVNLAEVANGRICLGSASYLYNDAAVLNDGSATNGILDLRTTPSRELTLVRVVDSQGLYCERDSGSFVQPNLLADADATELLVADAVPLAVHGFTARSFLNQETNTGRQSLYKIDIMIGTNEVDTLDNGSKTTCKPPTDNQANFEGCFVSQFETIVRAGEITQ